MKKNTLLRNITFLVTFLVGFLAYSQERTCGMVEYMEEKLKDPEFAKEYYKNQALFKEELRKSIEGGDSYRRSMPFVMIPVAVHFPGGSEANRACLEALAQNQIDILNADYSATNADQVQWNAASSNYPGVNPGTANIYFCLATMNHPAGTDPDLVEGGPAVTIGYNFGGGNDFDSNWSGYMNFLVKSINGGILGYSPLGGSSAAGQSVVLNTFAFGSGAGCPGYTPGAPYNLGRTVTHELGHFYNLNHTFTGSCASDDGIADTPNDSSNGNYGCPSAGSVTSCSNTVLTMNYMDYTNDACMYLFTEGQTAVVDAYMNVLSTQFHTDRTSCTTAPTASFSADTTSLCLDDGNTINFTDESGSSPTSWSWTFEGGTPSTSMDQNPVVTYDTPGTYDVSLTVTNADGSDMLTETDYIVVSQGANCSSCASYDSAQNLGLAIPDGAGADTAGPALTDTMNVPSGSDVLIDNFTINVDISHTYINDLVIEITHPNGTTAVAVWNRECSFENDLDVTFEDGAAAIACAQPTVGTYNPSNPLSVFNGLNSAGDWTISVVDWWNQDTGTLNDWSMEICGTPVLSVEENEFDVFALYPNPNNGEFTINLNSTSNSDIKVDVYDIRGRSIFNNTYSNTSSFNQVINLSNVQSGMYMVRVNDGERQTIRRIIVK